MSVYIHCRLKPIALSEETSKCFLIKARFSTHEAEAKVFKNIKIAKLKKKKSDIQERSNAFEAMGIKPVNNKVLPLKRYQPYTFRELEENYVGFSEKKKLNVEVCCGSGDFLLNAAKMVPDEIFVGIDVALPCVQRAVKKAEKDGLKNIWFYCGSGEDFFTFDFKNIKSHRIMVNFPDPWPKKRHVKRRVVSPLFLQAAVKNLEVGGQIITVTDVPPLAREHFELAAQLPNLNSKFSPPPRFAPSEAQDKFSSKFYSEHVGNSRELMGSVFLQAQNEVNNLKLEAPSVLEGARLEGNKSFLPKNFYKFSSAYQKKNLAKSKGFFITLHQKT